jgi:hypothetical protein
MKFQGKVISNPLHRRRKSLGQFGGFPDLLWDTQMRKAKLLLQKVYTVSSKHEKPRLWLLSSTRTPSSFNDWYIFSVFSTSKDNTFIS